ncbi:polar amino acid transport system substrate-binding protein [uncultured Gammaproteobacteria bacterium]
MAGLSRALRVGRWLATMAMVVAVMVAVLAKIATAEEVIRIGNEGSDYPPYYHPNAQGKLEGFEIDLTNALCAAMRVRCEIVIVPWDDIIQALLDHKIDAIISSMSITPERQQKVSFSDYYYSTTVRFISRKTANFTGLPPESVRGRAIGAQGNTVFAEYLAKTYGSVAKLELFDSQTAANQALIDGKVDVVLADTINLWNFLRTKEGECCQFHGEAIKAWTDVSGVAVRKEDESLRERFNRAIARIVADGTYEAINERHLPFSIY